jgi:hypothetical protein
MAEFGRYVIDGASFYFFIHVLSSISFNDLGMFILKLFGQV